MIWTDPAPKSLQANLDYRAALLLSTDTPARQRDVIERCRADIIWWIDSWCWQYNPDNRGHEVEPFICYPKQEEVIRKTVRRVLERRLRAIWRKSRKTGASWMMLYIEEHDCLFFSRRKFLNLSHTEDAVDRAGTDPDTLFWKVRFINDHLPGWMTGTVSKGKLGFWFHNTNSAITGTSTTERSGVGGRGTVFADEFAKHRKDYEILGQTTETGPQLFCSTFYGVGGAFYDLCQRVDSYVLTIHWSDFPSRWAGAYRSNPALPMGYEVLDTSFVYPPQCPQCSGLVDVPVGELTPCCGDDKGARARPYFFITDGKPTGGPHAGLRSPWYDAKCVEYGNERDVAMHLDINPQGSQSQFFDAIVLRQRISEHCCEPYWRGDVKVDADSGRPLGLVAHEDGPLKLWLRPTGTNSVPPANYGGGGDLSAGVGATPSVLSIGDVARSLKVAEYAASGIPPERFAVVACALGWLFADEDGTPLLWAWEANGGPGQMFGKTLIGLGYRRIFYRQSEQMFQSVVKSDVPGWWNNPRSKRLLLDNYKSALTNRLFTNRSEEALIECSLYRYSDKRDAVEHPKDVAGANPEEARSNHGDRVMADALCWMALEKLGAGQMAAKAKEESGPPAGSLAWRRMKREQKRREQEAWA